ncbi:MAG TPA: choice-of-anchor D domain-containing protein [Terriglobia bacterium]|nr:choice-of-anchor D domain-containing protein [Terriglobia bacterium]
MVAGASCTFNVTFQPLGKWLRTGSLYLYDNAAGSPQKVVLQGQGTAVALTPASLNFGSQPVGTTSAPQAIAVTNTGNIALKIWCIDTETGNIDDFIQTNTCGTELPAGGSCAISVRFRPKAVGNRTALIGVHDDGGGNPQTVPVSGTGS